MRPKLAFPTAALAVLILAAVAFAAKPIKGATYTGKINRTTNVVFAISFKVTSNGKHVTRFNVPNLPIYCQGGGFGLPRSKSGKVSKKGTFKVKLPIVFAPRHQNQGSLIVTGKFHKGGKESGKATTSFSHFTSCNGTSTYSTTG